MTTDEEKSRRRVVRHLSVYRTPSTLLFRQSSKRKYLHVTPVFSFHLDGERALPLTEYRSQKFESVLKLSVNKGILHVVFGSNRIERMIPQQAGLLAGHLDPVFFPRINDFLDQHFPGVVTTPASENEYAAIGDISMYDNTIPDDEKREVIDMAVRIISLAFPIASTFYSSRVNDGYYEMTELIDSKPRSFHYAPDYRSFVTRMFGGYRKDLAKVCATSTIKQMFWASLFKDLVPIDYMIDTLRNDLQVWDLVNYDMGALSAFPLRVVKLLMNDQVQLNAAIPVVEDALEMASFVPAEERKLCVTWQELHDRGMAHYQMVSGETGKVEFEDGFEEFFSEQSPVDGYSIVPLRTVPDFVETGKAMNVCVGSTPYVRRAFAKEGFCFRLDSMEDSPYALFEVRRSSLGKNWHVAQAATHDNRDVPIEIRAAVSHQLNKFIPMEGK